jgi:hypothetical protein
VVLATVYELSRETSGKAFTDIPPVVIFVVNPRELLEESEAENGLIW